MISMMCIEIDIDTKKKNNVFEIKKKCRFFLIDVICNVKLFLCEKESSTCTASLSLSLQPNVIQNQCISFCFDLFLEAKKKCNRSENDQLHLTKIDATSLTINSFIYSLITAMQQSS